MEFADKLRLIDLAKGLSLTVILAFSAIAVHASSPNASSPLPNRTVPKVAPPKAGREFQFEPSSQDFYRTNIGMTSTNMLQ
jgi:hypothetical protein